ncbi:hypothetical protein DFH06DRAFT_1483810 [Mycena polygramma]|nr:hypothetical protein DFH06DRAFT_1483810 [Mycena polygramma]
MPLATSRDFQVVSGNMAAVTVSASSISTNTVVVTVSNSISSAAVSILPSCVTSTSSSGARPNHKLIVLGAILGAAGLLLVILGVLVILLYSRNRRARATAALSCSTALTEELVIGDLTRELQKAQAEIKRLRTGTEGPGRATPALASPRPPTYRKRRD